MTEQEFDSKQITVSWKLNGTGLNHNLKISLAEYFMYDEWNSLSKIEKQDQLRDIVDDWFNANNYPSISDFGI
jgi:hypothetical protein